MFKRILFTIIYLLQVGLSMQANTSQQVCDMDTCTMDSCKEMPKLDIYTTINDTHVFHCQCGCETKQSNTDQPEIVLNTPVKPQIEKNITHPGNSFGAILPQNHFFIQDNLFKKNFFRTLSNQTFIKDLYLIYGVFII